MIDKMRIGGCLIFFLFFSFLSIPQNVYSQDSRAIQVVPDQEKRSSIHTIDVSLFCLSLKKSQI